MTAAEQGWAAPPLAPPTAPRQAQPRSRKQRRPAPAADPRALVSPARRTEFFAPRSIAVVGASDTSGWARFVAASAAATGFSGSLIPVHPVHRTVFGRPVVASLRDLAEPVDLAFVMVPEHAVEGVLDDAGVAGVRGAIVLASGGKSSVKPARLRRIEESGRIWLLTSGSTGRPKRIGHTLESLTTVHGKQPERVWLWLHKQEGAVE